MDLTTAERSALQDAIDDARESWEEEAGLDPDGEFAGYVKSLDAAVEKIDSAEGDRQRVVLTPDQLRCLLVGPWAMGYGLAEARLWVEQDSDGWVFVGDANDPDQEGMGVYVDTDGVVYYSPASRDEGVSPWETTVLSQDDDEIVLRVRARRA